MGRTISIRFKNGKVDKITPLKDPHEAAAARAFAEAFIDDGDLGKETRLAVAANAEARMTAATANSTNVAPTKPKRTRARRKPTITTKDMV
jgi:hypothetical protein